MASTPPPRMTPSGVFLAIVGQHHEAWLMTVLERYRVFGEAYAVRMLKARHRVWQLDMSEAQIETAGRALSIIARTSVANVLLELFNIHVLTEEKMRDSAEAVTAVTRVCTHCGQPLPRAR